MTYIYIRKPIKTENQHLLGTKSLYSYLFMLLINFVKIFLQVFALPNLQDSYILYKIINQSDLPITI